MLRPGASRVVPVLLLLLAGCGAGSSSSSQGQAGQQGTTALTVTAPTNGTQTGQPSIVVRGTATPGAVVSVASDATLPGASKDGIQAPTGNWQTQITLAGGRNNLSILATKTGQLPANGVDIVVIRTLTPAQKAAAAAQAAAARQKAAAQAAAQQQAAAQKAAAAKQAAAQKAAADKQAFISAAKAISYANLIKDTAPYVGEKIALHGQIFQIQQHQGQGGVLLVAVTDNGGGFWTDNVWVDYDHDISFVQNDLITVYGTVTGTKSYQTQAGGTTYVPEVHAVYIEPG